MCLSLYFILIFFSFHPNIALLSTFQPSIYSKIGDTISGLKLSMEDFLKSQMLPQNSSPFVEMLAAFVEKDHLYHPTSSLPNTAGTHLWRERTEWTDGGECDPMGCFL
ncbi:hypothetical protein NE237_014985 [Protea cynaroides]|uniref:Uncharacterized protein n=1 Tax=Protea cynaroides TaxID=273540 RepID=A0A9Q0KD65_9MAGN|nr:hypothetical protein NE237_014985 [Protea cynaroides]